MRNAASREEHLVGGIKCAPLVVALTQLSVEMIGVARRWVDRLPMVLGRNDAPSGQFVADANATNDDKRASNDMK